MKNDHPKILFITKGETPDVSERQEAAHVGIPVEFRSVASINEEKPETCDAALGVVVPAYEGKYDWQKIVTDFRMEQEEAKVASADNKAIKKMPAPAPEAKKE